MLGRSPVSETAAPNQEMGSFRQNVVASKRLTRALFPKKIRSYNSGIEFAYLTGQPPGAPMLIIRKEQMAELERVQTRNFHRKLVAYLRSLSSGGHNSRPHDQTLDSIVAQAIAAAPRFALTREKDVAELAKICLLHFGDVEQGIRTRQALAILTRYGQDSSEKLETFRQWAAGRK